MRYLFGFVLFLLALGTLRTVGCGDESPCGDCNDGNPCTIDQCSSRRVGEPPGMCEPDERPVEPYCSHRAEPDGTPCGGGNGVSGVCIDGVCDLCERAFCEPDDNTCTADCNPATGTCDYIRLEDGTSCNYDGLSGVCMDGECGQDPCEVVSCDDNDACTDDSCWLGECDHTPVVCDDGNMCTEDTCDRVGGCMATPVDDGTPCGNGTRVCQAGSCVGTFACTEQGIRDAIAVGGGPHTFDCEGQTTVVTEAEIVIDNDVILDGEGNLTVDGNRDHRVFSVSEGVTAELDRFAVTRGSPTGVAERGSGGGIYNSGVLTLTNSNVSGNSVDWGGGGIYNSGALTLTNSNVSENTADYGGGILHHSGVLTLTNSNVSENTADGGGGIDFGGDNSVVLLTNSTVSGNSARGRGGGISCSASGSLVLMNSTVSGNSVDWDGGGIAHTACAVTLTNSTVSGNTAASGDGVYAAGITRIVHSTISGANAIHGAHGQYMELDLEVVASVIEGNCHQPTEYTTWTSLGYNIESPGDTCGFDQKGDQPGVTEGQLALGPLQHNGGPTMTHALETGSVAIDAIPGVDCVDADGDPLTTDQRGFTRPVGDGCDVGAFERQPED